MKKKLRLVITFLVTSLIVLGLASCDQAIQKTPQQLQHEEDVRIVNLAKEKLTIKSEVGKTDNFINLPNKLEGKEYKDVDIQWQPQGKVIHYSGTVYHKPDAQAENISIMAVITKGTARDIKHFVVKVSHPAASEMAMEVKFFGAANSEVDKGSEIELQSKFYDDIYYTLDGSLPTLKSIKYTTPIKITGPVTIKAIAVKEGYSNSIVSEKSYTLKNYTVTLKNEDGTEIKSYQVKSGDKIVLPKEKIIDGFIYGWYADNKPWVENTDTVTKDTIITRKKRDLTSSEAIAYIQKKNAENPSDPYNVHLTLTDATDYVTFCTNDNKTKWKDSPKLNLYMKSEKPISASDYDIWGNSSQFKNTVLNEVHVLDNFKYLFQTFNNCSINKIYVGDTDIMLGNPFLNSNIKEIYIGKGEVQSQPQNILINVQNLEKITVDSANPSLQAVDGVLYTKDGKYMCHWPVKKDISKEILEKNLPKECIGFYDNAISYRDDLTSLIIPDQIKEIHGFYHNKNLKKLVLSKNLTLFTCDFLGCTDIEIIYIPKFTESAFKLNNHLIDNLNKLSKLKENKKSTIMPEKNCGIYFEGTEEEWYTILSSNKNYWIERKIPIVYNSNIDDFIK